MRTSFIQRDAPGFTRGYVKKREEIFLFYYYYYLFFLSSTTILHRLVFCFCPRTSINSSNMMANGLHRDPNRVEHINGHQKHTKGSLNLPYLAEKLTLPRVDLSIECPLRRFRTHTVVKANQNRAISASWEILYFSREKSVPKNKFVRERVDSVEIKGICMRP